MNYTFRYSIQKKEFSRIVFNQKILNNRRNAVFCKNKELKRVVGRFYLRLSELNTYLCNVNAQSVKDVVAHRTVNVNLIHRSEVFFAINFQWKC